MSKPLLICMTPVRNEAWVLNAFLKATSLLADYVLIISHRYEKSDIIDEIAVELKCQ